MGKIKDYVANVEEAAVGSSFGIGHWTLNIPALSAA